MSWDASRSALDVRPPLIEPGGPRRTDAAVVLSFLRWEPTGYSSRLHSEGPVLLAGREVPLLLRIGRRTILLRRDLPDEMDPVRVATEAVLTVGGLQCLDRETLLAVPVALQLVGLRLSSWDLWGDVLDTGFEVLRTMAVGEMPGPE